MNHDLRTQFLAEYASELEKRCDRTTVIAETLEAAEHLDALIRANVELGDNQDVATQNAIAQFGRAQELGKSVAKASSASSEKRRWIMMSLVSFFISYWLLLKLCGVGDWAGVGPPSYSAVALQYSAAVTAFCSAMMYWGRDRRRHNLLTLFMCSAAFFTVGLPVLLAVPYGREAIVYHSFRVGLIMTPMVVLVVVSAALGSFQRTKAIRGDQVK
ncbi:MAG: hypothetical protein WCK51_09220 [Armatimonadota bacterium]